MPPIHLYQNKLDMKKLSILLMGIMMLTSITAMSTENKKDSSIDAAEAAPIMMSTITGKVVDSNTGEALAGVTVAIEGTDLVAFTDFDGNFQFSNLKLQSAKLCASFISYEKASVSVNKSAKELVLTLKSVY